MYTLFFIFTTMNKKELKKLMPEKHVFCPFAKYILDSELDIYRDFIKFNENNIALELNKIEKRFNETKNLFVANNAPYEYFEILEENFESNHDKLNSKYLINLRNSQVIMLYSYLEINLKKGCDNFSKWHDKEYRLNDLNGFNDFDKVKKFRARMVIFK